MNLQDIVSIAGKRGVDAVNLSKTQLIRAIQRAEGSIDCYSTY